MTPTQTQFVTDETGRRVAVLVGIDQYRALLEAADEIDAIRAYDEAVQHRDEAIPFEEAVAGIERPSP